MVKFGAAPNRARIKTGTYTGDGTESQAITGIGFEPKMLWIWEHHTSETSDNISHSVKTDTMDTEYSSFIATTSYVRDSRIISLDSDGFTVDDDASDSTPNKDGDTYDYVAFG